MALEKWKNWKSPWSKEQHTRSLVPSPPPRFCLRLREILKTGEDEDESDDEDDWAGKCQWYVRPYLRADRLSALLSNWALSRLLYTLERGLPRERWRMTNF